MALAYRKKDIKEELKILHKEENKVVSVGKAVGKALVVPASASFMPADKATRKTSVASGLAVPAIQSPTTVVATTALSPDSGEPTIFEDLARHKKHQKGPDGEI